MKTEYEEGYNAYFEGKGSSDCPYDENPQKDEWEIGWLSANNDDLQSEYYNGDPTQEML